MAITSFEGMFSFHVNFMRGNVLEEFFSGQEELLGYHFLKKNLLFKIMTTLRSFSVVKTISLFGKWSLWNPKSKETMFFIKSKAILKIVLKDFEVRFFLRWTSFKGLSLKLRLLLRMVSERKRPFLKEISNEVCYWSITYPQRPFLELLCL